MSLKRKVVGISLGVIGLVSIASCSSKKDDNTIYYSYATGSDQNINLLKKIISDIINIVSY